MTTIATYLKRAGTNKYRRKVEEWPPKAPPRSRGYDSWLGYWHHSNDYWQHVRRTCSGKPVKDL